MIIKIVNEELTALMGGGESKLTIAPKPPTVIMLAGFRAPERRPTGQSLRAISKTGQAAADGGPAMCTGRRR
jgi:signal recognition particle subunit SRP54